MGCNCDSLLQLDAGAQGPQGVINPALPTLFNLDVTYNVYSGISPFVPWVFNSATEISKNGNVWGATFPLSANFSINSNSAEITISNFLGASFTNQSFSVFIDRKKDVYVDQTTWGVVWQAGMGHPWRWEVSEYGINSVKIMAISTQAPHHPIQFNGSAFFPEILTTSFSLLIMTT